MVADGAFRHTIDYVTFFWEILNPEGHPNRITGLLYIRPWPCPVFKGAKYV